MRNLSVVLLGLAMLLSSAGCMNPWYGYGYQGYPGGCPGGNCQYGTAPGMVAPQGAFYGPNDPAQANLAPFQVSPVAQQSFYPAQPMTAMGPSASLPTY